MIQSIKKTDTIFDREQLQFIAIRPLAGCAQYLLKALRIGETYYFSRKYVITPNGDRISINKEKNDISYDFFSPCEKDGKYHPLINLNVIVGKNGDGKSSLIELYVRIINNLSYAILHKKKGYEGCFIKDLNAELYFAKESYKLKETEASSITRKYYRLRVMGESVDMKELRYSHSDKGENITERNVLINRGLLQKFFFSMVVNYSIFSYNIYDYKREWKTSEKYDSCWLHNLFHKNDGYQTPIVLHPFRNKGNIDINIENSLTKSRLITLFIEPANNKALNFRVINKKQKVKAITCELKVTQDSQLEKIGVNEKYCQMVRQWDFLDSDLIANSKQILPITDVDKLGEAILDKWAQIYNFSFPSNFSNEKHKVLIQAAKEYLIYKTISISQKYDIYREEFSLFAQTDMSNRSLFEKKLKKILIEMSKDRSHITLKIRQTIAFLKFRISDWNTDRKKIPLDDVYKEISSLATIDNDGFTWELIDLLPPPIFKTDIVLENSETKEEESINDLSSGERQQIYSISSILYHLRNLNSVQQNTQKGYIHYRHINLILEEIELYFHPEFQRSFIKYLLDSITNIDLPEIDSINVMLVTHSPFILSDIPKENVLFLKDGYPENQMQENTFGANIYNLYKNSFFLNGMPIGEFAISKIQNLFAELQKGNATPELRKEIMLVGEPIIKNQLLKLYNENLPGEYFNQEIQRMEQRLNKYIQINENLRQEIDQMKKKN